MADAAAAVRDKIQARLQTPQLVDAAADIAHYILRGAPERLEHSRGVAERAMFLTLAVEDDQAPLLVAAAWLHDIGYGPGLKTTRLPSARRSTLREISRLCSASLPARTAARPGGAGPQLPPRRHRRSLAGRQDLLLRLGHAP